jgi:hypothetical protein
LNEEEMIQFNEDAFQNFNDNALVPCKHCSRTFLPEALKIHRKICTAEKPFKPLNKKKKQQQRAKNSWEDKPVGGGGRNKASWEDEPIGGSYKGGGGGGGGSRYGTNNRNGGGRYEDELEVPTKKPAKRRNPNLYKKKPKKKMKNYYEDSEEDDVEIMNNYSYSRPKQGAHLNQQKSKPSFKTNQKPEKSKMKPSKYGTSGYGNNRAKPKPKPRKKPMHQMRRNMYADEDDEEEESPRMQRQAPKKKRPKPRSKPQPEITYDFSGPPANLEQCRICGRSFAEDRIKKHMNICKIQSRKKTKVKRFHKKVTQKEKRKIAKNKPVSKWKQQHQEFVKQMRYMRKLKKVEEEGGDIRMVAPPPPSSQPGLVPCKHCGRKFREQAHARHENICKTVFGGKKGPTRPKKTKLQRRRGY